MERKQQTVNAALTLHCAGHAVNTPYRFAGRCVALFFSALFSETLPQKFQL
jgi:hypothetical protein